MEAAIFRISIAIKKIIKMQSMNHKSIRINALYIMKLLAKQTLSNNAMDTQQLYLDYNNGMRVTWNVLRFTYYAERTTYDVPSSTATMRPLSYCLHHNGNKGKGHSSYFFQ